MSTPELPRVLAAAHASRFGFTRAAVRHRLDRGRWQRLLPGVLATHGNPPARDDWILAGLQFAGPSAALSGWDAARLHGAGARQPPTDQVLILDRRGRHRSFPHVRIRPTQRRYATEPLPADHDPLAFVEIVEAARAVADTALTIPSIRDVRALVTGALQRQCCTPERLEHELRTGPRNHSAGLRVGVADALVFAKSVAEAEAAQRLTTQRVPIFELNVPIVDATGAVWAEADVLWRELRAVLEIDGRDYHLSEESWQKTLERNALLARRGLAVLQCTPKHIRYGGRRWAAEVEEWLRQRARDVGVPYVPGCGPIRPGPDGPQPLALTGRSRRPAA